jgi:hypothetical protein
MNLILPFNRRFLMSLMALVVSVGAARADYQSTVLSQGPVGYWRLNETTHPSAATVLATNIGASGARGNGTYIAAERALKPGAIAAEPNDTAVGFAGVVVSNRVRIDFQPEWNPSGPLTVEFWAKPSQTAVLESPASSVEFIPVPVRQRNGWLFYQGNPDLTDGNGWVFREYNSGGLTNLTTASVNMALDTNTWYHVVGVFDGSNISTYVNGILGATTAFSGTPRPNTNSAIPLTFGARADGSEGYFTYGGQLDEAAIYDAALSPARILAHYQAGTNSSAQTPYSQVVLADAPVGYWRFDEPGDPPAVNLGSLGAAATGAYVYNASPGAAGPRPPDYPGFDPTNTAVSFDGVTGGYVSVPGPNLNTNTVTMTAWINASGAQYEGMSLIGTRSDQTVAGITVDIGGGLGLSYNWADDPATFNWASSLSLADSDWTYVALTVEPSRAVLFVASAANAGTWAGATNPIPHIVQSFEAPILFGADIQAATNLFLKGVIDEVAIFNRALRQGELYTAYASAVGGVAATLFADVTAPVDQPFLGDTLSLSVDVGGTPPLAYQWRKDGVPISGATSSALSIPSLQSINSGSYDVVVTNLFGSVQSSPAVIGVQTPTMPVIVQGPVGRTLYVGGELNLAVQATGGELHYQWQKAGTNLPGATTSTYTVQRVTAADSGEYQVSVTNSVGPALAGPASVTVVVPAPNSYEAMIITDQPEAWWRLDEPAGATEMHDAMGRHDGTYVGSGVTLGAAGVVSNGLGDTAASFDGNSFGVAPYSAALNPPEFTLEAWGLIADQSVPRALVSTYDTASHKGIFFAANPDSTWESDVGLSDTYLYYFVGLGGFAPARWSHIVTTFSASAGMFEYLNGQQVAGPFADFKRNAKFDFLIGAVGTNWPGANFGRWKGRIDEVAVYTYALTPQQIQNHYIQALYGVNSKPVFLTQPASATLALNDVLYLPTKVEGSIPITYQWLKNGIPIPAATNDTYVVAYAQYTDTGTYQLVASNVAGTNQSTAVSVVVLPPITFANATNGLVLHLKFDGDYNDSSGRGNDGTAIGAPAFVAGKIGQALHYSTSTDKGGVGGVVTNSSYVTLGTPQDLLFGASGNFSVAFWVKLPSGDTSADLPFLSSAVNAANAPGFTFAPSFQAGGWQWDLDQVIGAITNNIDVNGADNSINNGAWHHFAATFDRATVALTYLDGVQVNSTSIAALGTFDTTNSVSIGQDPTGKYAVTGSATLDDLGVWRRVLSPLEVYEIFYSGTHYGVPLDAYGPVTLGLSSDGGIPLLIWQAGTLMESDSLSGSWTIVTGATPPMYSPPAGSGTKFYRVRL